MAQLTKTFPTYEFESDPLPPQPQSQTESAPNGFRATETVQLGDLAIEITRRVDGATPWRETGNTDFESFQRAISRAFPPETLSPLAAEAREMYDVLREAGLTRFAAAMLWHEKKNDTWPDSPIPQHFRNPFSTRDRENIGQWERHPSYAAATRAWVRRVGASPYPQQGTMREFVEIYAPGFENDVDLYVKTLANEINELPIENALPAAPKGRALTIAGLATPVFVPSDFPYEQKLTPVGPNRPGRAMNPQGVTQHETNNLNPGMGARGHSQWQDDGTPGHPDGPVGVHFYVDDTVVIQKIPVNETSIHAGSPGNESHISVELCVNSDRDAQRAERNAAVLAAALLRDGLGRGVEALKGHNDWWPANPCPRILRDENRWPAFKQAVADLIAEVKGETPTFPGLPPTMPVEVFLSLFPQANPEGPVTRFYIDYCVKHLPPGQWPRLNGSRQLADGATWWDFNPLHIFSDGQGKVWIAEGAAGGPESAAQQGTLGAMSPEATMANAPPRDFAEKEAAMERDRERRRAVIASQAKLFDRPKGEVIRTLPAGTRLTVLGAAEDRFVPVSVRDGGERGYVRENELADDPEDKDKDKDKDKTPGPGPDPNGGGGGGHVSAAGAGRRIAEAARGKIGSRYVFATHGPDTFDCSGLVHWAVLEATGTNISPDSHAQFNTGATVTNWDELQIGDVLFYDTMDPDEVREGNNASHVGIYIGSNRMVNALNEQTGVREDDAFSDYFRPKYLGARRMA